jgi:RNA polymerase sigma factor (sigma-70 family)
MRSAALGTLVAHIQQLAGREASTVQSDSELLVRFSADGDEAAFASLVQRHGATVWRVCRNVLHHDQDAEDAFQATFAVLARKAGTIVNGDAVASWLHGVAYRVATRASRDTALRRARERERAKFARPEPATDLDLREALAVVDEEVQKLPEKQRAAFVLCYLEGRSVTEAARLMDMKPGTVAVRLSRARARLRQSLSKRGVTLSAALSVVALARSSASAYPAFLLSVVKGTTLAGRAPATAASIHATRVVALFHEAVNAMSAIAVKPRFVLLLALCLLGTGLALFARPGATEEPARLATAAEPPVPVLLARASDDAKPVSEKKAVDPAAEDLREMRGTWTTTTIERRFINGEPQPPREKKVTFVIDGEKLFILGDDGFIDQQMTLKLDPSQEPKAVDLVDRAIGTFVGIYQLNGDALRIDFVAKNRPTKLPADDKLAWGVLRRVSRTPATATQRFANAPGWYWTVEPKTTGGTFATLGIVVLREKDREGATVVTLASPISGSGSPKHRPVFLDAGKNRYLAAANGGGTSDRLDGTGVSLNRWRLDPKVLPDEKVALIGIESLAPESRPTAGRSALERARKEGVEVLPCPELGKVLDFTLTSIEGKKIRSANLHGKVILIDCWETWCSPCVERLPELKSLYEQSHKDGLEIIGVSFDRNVATLKRAIDKHGLPWPHVLVPTDDATQNLWHEATGIDSVPRILLIDRQGILRADNPQDLKGEIDKLLNDAAGKAK